MTLPESGNNRNINNKRIADMIPMYSRSYLNLMREIAVTRFKLKDQSTFFGLLWSFLNPVLMLTILFTIFSFRAGQGIDHYAIYLLIGVVQYTHFSNTTAGGMSILCSMEKLTSDVIFPKEVLVIGTVIADTVEFVVSLIFCLGIAIAFGIQLSWPVLLLPVVILMQLMFVLWVSMFLSIFYIYVRDLRHIYQVFLRMLFFATPIFYRPEYVGDGIGKYIIQMNPLTHLIQFARTLLIEGRWPSWEMLLLTFAANTALLFLGIAIFRRYEPTFAEYL